MHYRVVRELGMGARFEARGAREMVGSGSGLRTGIDREDA